MKPLDALDLRLTPCATPGCAHDDCNLWLMQKCHPRAGTEAIFNKRNGLVTIICHKCKSTIVQLELADPIKERTV
jgi:hypothetical protein